VGTVTYFWADSSRPDQLTEDPDDPRQVPVQLWYPAGKADGCPAAYMPDLELLSAGLETDPKSPPTRLPIDGARLALVRLHATLNPPAAERVEAFPLVVVSPGGNVSRHWHAALAQDLASRGYVVAVISHAHSGLDVFPIGGLLRSHPRWDPDHATEEDRERLDQERTDLLATDARFVLDRLGSLDEGPLVGRVDMDRVAILGHSRGGSTVSRACATDRRFKACVIFDNVGSEPERSRGLKQPMMTVRSAGEDWPEERAGRVDRYLANTGSWAYEVVIEGAGHFSFTDIPLIDPAVFQSAINPQRAHRLICDYTTLFLEVALGGRHPGDLEARAATDPEVVLTVYEAGSEARGIS
jgi:dienelactone hydrolase